MFAITIDLRGKWVVPIQLPIFAMSNLAFHPQLNRFLDVGDRTVQTWDYEKRMPIGRETHVSRASMVDFSYSPDGKHYAVADMLGNVGVFDVNHVEKLLQIPSRQPPRALTYSPDGKYLAVVYSNPMSNVVPASYTRIKLIDLTAPQKNPITVATIDEPTHIKPIAFHPTLPYFAAGCDNGDVIVWNTNGWRKLGVMERQFNSVSKVAFSPDGRWLIAAGYDERGHFSKSRTVKLWDVGTLQNQLEQPEEVTIEAAVAELAKPRDFGRSIFPRILAAQALHENRKFVPKELVETFRKLPTPGVQQATLLATYLYRTGKISLEELRAQIAEMTAWEKQALLEQGDTPRLAMEVHTAISQEGSQGAAWQQLLDLTMTVFDNQDAAGSLRVRTLFEDGGLEIQSLPSASPLTQARIWEYWEDLAASEGLDFTFNDMRDSWVHINMNGVLLEPQKEACLYRWAAENANFDKLIGRSPELTTSSARWSHVWLVRPPTPSRLAEAWDLVTSRYRTEITGFLYVEPKSVPHPGVNLAQQRQQFRDYRRGLLTSVWNTAQVAKRTKHDLFA
jgi:hypothetical protein